MNTSDAPAAVVDDDTIRPSWTVQRQRFQVYQLYLPGHEFVWERIPADATTRFVFAPIRLPELSNAGYRIRWRDPIKPMALWERPAGGGA